LSVVGGSISAFCSQKRFLRGFTINLRFLTNFLRCKHYYFDLIDGLCARGLHGFSSVLGFSPCPPLLLSPTRVVASSVINISPLLSSQLSTICGSKVETGFCDGPKNTALFGMLHDGCVDDQDN
jgi:hypothetical protein